MSRLDACDFCKAERKWSDAVATLPWPEPNADSLGLCTEHLDALLGSRADLEPDEQPVQCTWPGCGKWSKNKRALQSHLSRHRRLEKEDEPKTATLAEVK
jgi:hypothetical protein